MPPLTPLLNAKLRRIAHEYQRGQQLRRRVRAGLVFLVLLAFLTVALPLSEALELPFVAPCVVAVFVFVFVYARWLRRPQRRALAVGEVAQLVDQHYPELENLVVSSVEFSREEYSAPSEWIVAQVLENADWHSRDIKVSTLANSRSTRQLRLSAMLLWSVGFVAFLLLVLPLDFARLRAGFFVPIAYLELPFIVEPGDVRVRYGSEQTVWVRGADPELSGALRWRRRGGNWQSAALLPGRAAGVHHFRLRDLVGDVEYQVQLGTRRSPSYRISVWMPPAVEAVHLRYTYPAYLGIAPREVVDGGHITALAGTQVELEVAVNKELVAAGLALESGDFLDLSQDEPHLWTGKIVLERDDVYRIVLRDKDGNENDMPTSYRIVASEDEPPELRVRFPRGDTEATALEEIAFSFVVSDDYGLGAYGLEYEVAGREKVRLSLGSEGVEAVEVEGEYLLALEELDLRAGDLLTWALWAEDQKPGRSAYETLGDPYFIEVRPFYREYSEAISDEGTGSGGADEGRAAEQKQVIIATWNLRRDANALDPAEFGVRNGRIATAQEEVLSAATAQGPAPGREHVVAGLRGEVAAALEALAHAGEPDSIATSIASLTRAMTHQQRAYHYLLQLAPAERQVTQNSGGQGGGGGRSDSARDRELEALETARRRDFREEASTLAEQMQAAEEARDGLEELARRQEFLNEDMAALVSELQSEDGEVRAEAERRLEELRSEQQRVLEALDQVGGRVAGGELDAGQRAEARQQLEQARRQMERSAEELERGETQRARAAGRRAQEALSRAERDLDQLSRDGMARRLEQLGAGLDSLRERQAVAAKGQRSEGNELGSAQEALAEDFARFMGEAGELAERSGQDLLARKLGDWLRQTSRQGIYEDLRESSKQARYGASVQTLEEEVDRKLALARARLDSLQHYLATDDLDARRKALAQIRDLASDLERRGAGAAGEDSQGRGGGEEGDEQSETGRSASGIGDYRAWSGNLRDARELLPEDSAARQMLGGISEGLAELGRGGEGAKALPQYDLVFERAILPLQRASAVLEREIEILRGAREVPPIDANEVPPRYRQQVAEYFERLSEMKGE